MCVCVCMYVHVHIEWQFFVILLFSPDMRMAEEEEGKEYRWETGYEKTW